MKATAAMAAGAAALALMGSPVAYADTDSDNRDYL
jgi:hypothetical protein